MPDEEDDFDFEERFKALKEELMTQVEEETRLNDIIIENLEKVKLDE